MWSRRVVAMVLLLGVARVDDGVAPATACGPNFPIEWLVDPGTTETWWPEGVFLVEAARLVPAPSAPYRLQLDNELRPPDAGSEEHRRYERGDYAGVLRLPAAERRHRTTWAAYMLAETAVTAEARIAGYRQVRAWVAQGFDDLGGLAMASLGQEAGVEWREGQLGRALELYALQAAHGDPGGAASVLMVVRTEVEAGRWAALTATPVGRAALAQYLRTRRGELDDTTWTRAWQHLLKHRSAEAALPMALTAYRRGEWALAAELVGAVPDVPEALWLRSRLAKRDGQVARAHALLQAAVDGLAARPNIDDADARMLAGLRMTLASDELDRAGYLRAAQAAWAAREHYPFDAVYLAERVLTVSELRRWVDGASAAEREGGWLAPDALRSLLARRLWREGDRVTALGYFTDEVRGHATSLHVALERVRDAVTAIDRAEARFTAAALLRAHGLEIAGTGHAPDWGVVDAQFDLGDEGDRATQTRRAEERTRVEASAPAHATRFHYRLWASHIAERAADELPERSQAFAAVLCHAAHYVHDPRAGAYARVEALHQRAVDEGAVLTDMAFGWQCPAPDFAAARAMRTSVGARARRETRTVWRAIRRVVNPPLK